MVISSKAIERISQILHGRENQQRSEPMKSSTEKSLDEVTLSSKGQEMLALQRRLADVPEVRADRVQELRDAIQKGEYRVSSEQIAERILDQNDRAD